MASKDTDRRSIAIDALRGVAVLLVIVRHWPSDATDPTPFRIAEDLGWVGVDLFFVLSGYLISTLLYRELDETGGLNLFRFWIRRGLRIWPAYFAAFVGVFLVGTLYAGIAHHDWSLPVDQWPNLLLIQNYFPEGHRWPHTWSLAVEEHFYIALPLILLSFGRRRLLVLGLMLCTLCLALRIAMAPSASWADLYYPTHLRFDALMIGVMVGYVSRYHPGFTRAAARHWPAIVGFGAGALLAIAFNPLETSAFTRTSGFLLLDIAFGGVVLLAAMMPPAADPGGVLSPFATVGAYSYSIYLAHGAMIHLPGYGALIAWAGGHGGVLGARAAFILIAVAGGLLLSWAVERPALRFRKRLTPAPAARPSVVLQT